MHCPHQQSTVNRQISARPDGILPVATTATQCCMGRMQVGLEQAGARAAEARAQDAERRAAAARVELASKYADAASTASESQVQYFLGMGTWGHGNV